MSVSSEKREIIRERANYACEYCGVKEEDSAGKLTIDHFIPQSKGGTDEITNLVYCCFRCNLYKHSYFASNPTTISIWNPRVELYEIHFTEKKDGILYGLTPIGKFTIENSSLIENR